MIRGGPGRRRCSPDARRRTTRLPSALGPWPVPPLLGPDARRSFANCQPWLVGCPKAFDARRGLARALDWRARSGAARGLSRRGGGGGVVPERCDGIEQAVELQWFWNDDDAGGSAQGV